MSMSIGMMYANYKRDAEQRGWPAPGAGSVLDRPNWHEAWIRYWQAMERYETKVAAGDPDPGRPVQPHR